MQRRLNKRSRLESSHKPSPTAPDLTSFLKATATGPDTQPAPKSHTENMFGVISTGSKDYLLFPSSKSTVNSQGEASESVDGSSIKPPVKKLVIKALKDKPKLPENYEALTWGKLQTAVRAIHNKQAVEDSLEELYKACENLCLHKLSSSLYERLKNECETHVINELEKLLSNVTENEVFLAAMNQCWLDHQQQMGLLRSIFLYLDRTYVLQTSGVASLWDMGLDVFRTHIMSSSGPLKQKTSQGLLILIARERDGERVDRSLLHSLIRMYIDLSLYFKGFEQGFLDATLDYYEAEGNRLIDVWEIPQYLRHVQNRLQEEEDRNRAYLDRKTKKGLANAVEARLLQRHLDVILERGFPMMMTQEQLADLALLYNLLSQINALDKLRFCFGLYIKKVGADIVTDDTKDSQMVEEMLELKRKMDDVVRSSFHNNPTFNNTLKESFENFINQRQNKPAELIAKYLDRKLRAHKGINEEEMDQIMDDALLLFRYIQGKDIFEAFYKRDLAKRLLLNRSASKDAEKSMLSRLKQECGAGFTSKLEGMFKDIDLSREIVRTFRSSKLAAQIAQSKIEMDVNVLTQGFWPTYPPSEANIPTQITDCQKIFQEFYLLKYAGRNLKWQNSLGTCVLGANFPRKKKDLVVSLFQAVVLLLFNDSTDGKLSYNEIKESSRIEQKELDRTLQSLACGKTRVLLKHPKSREINTDDEFYFNKDFEDKLTRIKINSIQLKETTEENQMTTERVFLDRQYQVDAALVRIMKMRKKLGHNQLVSELIKQLKFQAQVPDIKKRIESLIDREYLERDKEDKNKIIYLA
ncbi:hypothetical protein G9A89_018998 [Geosiphon pyriformis]|nr:hypothetical protein G9A89_018998 [Geosiphon pyriformis]